VIKQMDFIVKILVLMAGVPLILVLVKKKILQGRRMLVKRIHPANLLIVQLVGCLHWILVTQSSQRSMRQL
jgi:hypothetical protein